MMGVRFCDGCDEVSMPDQPAQRRYEDGHAAIQAWHLPR
jgi:hypothetical protein